MYLLCLNTLADAAFTPEQRRAALILLILAVLGIAVVVLLALWIARNRHQTWAREREAAAKRKRAAGEVDPWAESSRRMGAATVGEGNEDDADEDEPPFDPPRPWEPEEQE